MEDRSESRERILVCISPSPSNLKVIMAAAKMARAFQATLTAIYVKPTNYSQMRKEDKTRLGRNIMTAKQNGASIITIVGDDVPLQVAEYARISGTTKIVVGRSGARRKHFWSKTPLTEQLILEVPDVDVYIIPDSVQDIRKQKTLVTLKAGLSWKDTLISLLLLLSATAIGSLFTLFGFSKANIITVFLLAVLIISIVTISLFYSALSSLVSVLLFNWFFIEPRFSFHTYETEYAVTFGIMLITSLISSTLSYKMKMNARQYAREAFRAKVLFDTNQLLQKAEKADEIMDITARQITTLIQRDVVVYPAIDSHSLAESNLFGTASSLSESEIEKEKKIALYVHETQQPAGLNQEHFPSAGSQFFAIAADSHSYGVISIRLEGRALENFENSVFLSILGECTLSLERVRNAEERQRASIMAKNEQLRANLLRSISHDIRTPLTSILGNASNLLSHYMYLDDETRKQIFFDIHDEAQWLEELVENLLSISRIENGQMEIHRSLDVLDDVVAEAMKHVDRNISKHNVTVAESDEILLVNMDSRLIMQVVINLVNNAIKNTQIGSDIKIKVERRDGKASLSVTDNGPGISSDEKVHIFEMFYTGSGKLADGRRGLGLGLALSKSIIEAHGGCILLEDNEPSGCIFTILLPLEEVDCDE